MDALAGMNYSWDQLNFSRNCTAAAELQQRFFWASDDEFIPTIHAVQNYIRSAFPPTARRTTPCDMLLWFETKVQREPGMVLKHMYRASFDACPQEVCAAIQYPGDPDIMGIGVHL